MEGLADHGYSGINDGTKVCYFLQGIRRADLEAAVNVVWAQMKKYHEGFDTMMSYLGQMVMKKGHHMNAVYIAKLKSQLVKPKVELLMRKICKKYPKEVWNVMSREQQMQVRKLQE